MAKHRHLKNAPLTEALIDIRVSLPSVFDPKDFLSLSNDISDKYIKSGPRQMFTAAFGVEAGIPFTKATESKGVHGYICKSGDGKDVVQFRIDGFTFSRLNPYSAWETVLSEAKRLWELYSIKCSPELITRIAVRYINKLDLPLPIKDFADYLTAPPLVPDSLPQEVSQFLTRVVIHDADITANIVQAMKSSLKADHLGVILDIDVFKVNENGFEESSIWPEFEKLRALKNRIFFKSITEKTAGLYE
ncbi:MAG: TIGR04255 family protein [Dehalococcoidia bacterium]|nr:TIGR04255 family protein [Dehalococcoidia bacterium]